MKVVDNRKPITKVAFIDLPVGSAYFDSHNVFCIKTSCDEVIDENCICSFGAEGWRADRESLNTMVTPANVIITIEG